MLRLLSHLPKRVLIGGAAAGSTSPCSRMARLPLAVCSLQPSAYIRARCGRGRHLASQWRASACWLRPRAVGSMPLSGAPYHALLRACDGDVPAAVSLVREMHASGVAPTAETFKVFQEACGSAEAAEQAWVELAVDGVVNAAAVDGVVDVDAAGQSGRGIKDTLLQAQKQQNEANDQVDKHERGVEGIEGTLLWKLLLKSTRGPVSCSSIERLIRDEYWSPNELEQCLAAMKELGIRPRTETFNMLVERAPNADVALRVLCHAKEHGMVRTDLVQRTLYHCKSLESALNVLSSLPADAPGWANPALTAIGKYSGEFSLLARWIASHAHSPAIDQVLPKAVRIMGKHRSRLISELQTLKVVSPSLITAVAPNDCGAALNMLRQYRRQGGVVTPDVVACLARESSGDALAKLHDEIYKPEVLTAENLEALLRNGPLPGKFNAMLGAIISLGTPPPTDIAAVLIAHGGSSLDKCVEHLFKLQSIGFKPDLTVAAAVLARWGELPANLEPDAIPRGKRDGDTVVQAMECIQEPRDALAFVQKFIDPAGDNAIEPFVKLLEKCPVGDVGSLKLVDQIVSSMGIAESATYRLELVRKCSFEHLFDRLQHWDKRGVPLLDEIYDKPVNECVSMLLRAIEAPPLERSSTAVEYVRKFMSFGKVPDAGTLEELFRCSGAYNVLECLRVLRECEQPLTPGMVRAWKQACAEATHPEPPFYSLPVAKCAQDRAEANTREALVNTDWEIYDRKCQHDIDRVLFVMRANRIKPSRQFYHSLMRGLVHEKYTGAASLQETQSKAKSLYWHMIRWSTVTLLPRTYVMMMRLLDDKLLLQFWARLKSGRVWYSAYQDMKQGESWQVNERSMHNRTFDSPPAQMYEIMLQRFPDRRIALLEEMLKECRRTTHAYSVLFEYLPEAMDNVVMEVYGEMLGRGRTAMTQHTWRYFTAARRLSEEDMMEHLSLVAQERIPSKDPRIWVLLLAAKVNAYHRVLEHWGNRREWGAKAKEMQEAFQMPPPPTDDDMLEEYLAEYCSSREIQMNETADGPTHSQYY